MSSWSFSYSSSSFVSWSSSTTTTSSSSSSRAINGSGRPQIRGQAYMRESHSSPAGSATRTTMQNLGQAPTQETRFYDVRGRERLPYHHQAQNGGFIYGVPGQRGQRQQQQQQQQQVAQGHVEEVDDDDFEKKEEEDDGIEVEEMLDEPVQNGKMMEKAFKKGGAQH